VGLQDTKPVLSVLAPGSRIEAEVRPDSPEIHAPRLDAWKEAAPVRGIAFELVVKENGPVTIEAHSHWFDAYLVVRDAQGEVLAENDNGWMNTHPRIAMDLAADRRYRLEVGALRGATGACSIACRAGRDGEISLADRRKSEYEDALACVRVREEELGPEHPMTAWSVNNVGTVLRMHGRFSESEEWCRRALATREKILGPEHADTAASINDIGQACWRLDRDVEAEALYRRALAIREKVLGSGHSDTARSISNLGIVHNHQGRYFVAEECYRRSLAILDDALGPEHELTARTVKLLGDALSNQKRYVEAEEQYRRALEIREKALDPEDESTAQSANDLGDVLYHQGRYAAAEESYRRAFAIRAKVLGPEHADTVSSANDLGMTMLLQAHYAEAEEWHRRVLAIRERTLPPEASGIAGSATNLGWALAGQERFIEAEACARRALAIREKTSPPSPLKTAQCMGNLGVALTGQGRLEEAEEWHRRSLAILEESLGPDDLNTAIAASNVGVVLDWQRRYDEAKPWHDRVLATRERLLGPEHLDTARSLCNVAASLLHLGLYPEAEAFYRRAWMIQEKALDPGHPNRRQSLQGLGEAFLREGNLESARHVTREDFEELLAYARRQVATTAVDFRFRALNGLRSALFRLASLEMGPDRDRQELDELYAAFTAWKGLAFRIGLASRTASGPTDGSAGDGLANLRRRATDLASQISLLAYAQDIADADEHRRRFEFLREELRSVERQLFQGLGIRPERDQTSAADLGPRLPPGAALVDLVFLSPRRLPGPKDDPPAEFGGSPEPDRMLAWIVRAGASEPALVDLGPCGDLEPIVARALAELAPGLRGLALSNGQTSDTPSLTELREKIWDPLAAHLQGVTRLLVCPDGFLAELPFEAIPIDQGRTLLEVAEVSYVQDPVTLRDMLEATPARLEAPALLAVGGVDYSSRGKWEPREAQRDERATSRGDRSFRGRFESLPETRVEVDGILDLVRPLAAEPSKPLLMTDAAATEEAVKSLAPGRSLIHLATHGFYHREGLTSLWAAAMRAGDGSTDEPLGIGAAFDGEREAVVKPLEGVSPGLLTGVALAGVNSETPAGRDDGVLTADEVSRLDLSSCELAFLSACETALGQSSPGEGLISLRRAFQEAGARTVISTLWRVDDRATRELVGEFYRRYLVEKQPVGKALRGAKLHLLHDTQYKHPRYWAAFTLAGDWR